MNNQILPNYPTHSKEHRSINTLDPPLDIHPQNKNTRDHN